MVANRLGSDENKIDADDNFFNEVVDLEMTLSRQNEFLNFGRILTVLCQKASDKDTTQL